jgi:hypothetical protein
MIFNYQKEPYLEWENFIGVTFSRKLEYETAFDGVIKIYSLKTDVEFLNETLKGLFFHSFGYQTKYGVLLRQYKSKTSWPKTRLVHFNFFKNELIIIKNTNSSYDNWTVKELENDKLVIALTPDDFVEFENK